VDDVSAGHASLSYLRDLPVGRLTIDRSVVAGLGREPDDGALAGAIVGLAHALGLVVVGKGVETREQARILHALGCDPGQGHRTGRPGTAAELVERLLSDPTRCTHAGSGSRSAARPGGA